MTRAAAPAAREPPIQLDVGPLRPLRLAGELPAQLPPPGIGDRTCQAPVAHHPAYVERLGHEDLALVHDPAGHLVQEVRRAPLPYLGERGHFGLRPAAGLVRPCGLGEAASNVFATETSASPRTQTRAGAPGNWPGSCAVAALRARSVQRGRGYAAPGRGMR